MSQKMRKSPSENSKLKALLHTEDWNSRFWLNKIPDYKPKSALGAGKINLQEHKVPNRLPKIRSAHMLLKEVSPVIHEADSLKTLKLSLFCKKNKSMPDRYSKSLFVYFVLVVILLFVF